MRLALLDQDYQECIAATIKTDPDNFLGLHHVLSVASANPEGDQGKDGDSSPSESSSSSDEEEGVGHAYEGYQQYQQLDDDCEEEDEKSEEGNEGEGKGPIETTTTDDKIFSYVDWQKMQTTGEPSEEFKGKDDIFHQSFSKTYTTNFKQDEGEDWFDF